MGILQRLPRVGALFGLLEYVNLDEIPEAITSLTTLRNRVKATDFGSRESVGGVVDAAVDAVRQVVDVTKTDADDYVAELLAAPVEGNRDFVITAIIWLNARPDAQHAEFVSAMSAQHPQAVNLSTWLEIVMDIWTFIQMFRKQHK